MRRVSLLVLFVACGERAAPPKNEGSVDAGVSVDAGASSDAGSEDPTACASRACGALMTQCRDADICFSLDQCVDECASEPCLMKCLEDHGSSEGRRVGRDLFISWDDCFRSHCAGGRPTLRRENITECARTHCTPQAEACIALLTCSNLQHTAGQCFGALEIGYADYQSYLKTSCIVDGIANTRKYGREDTREQAITLYEALISCVNTNCGIGTLDPLDD